MAAKQAQEVGTDRQLFVDDFWIAGSHNVERALHKPTREEVAIASEHPWERLLSGYYLVMNDGSMWRMYYLCSGDLGWQGSGWPYCGYAESKDGIEWRKPELGIIDFEGSKENNLVYGGPHTEFAPFLDANPDARKDEQYKAFVVQYSSAPQFGARRGGLLPLASPDGLRWRPLSDEPVLTRGPFDFDSHNLPFWDSWRGEYVVYARGSGGRGLGYGSLYWDDELGKIVLDREKGGVRWIRRATSPDFRNWSPLVDIDCGDAPFEELYTNACTPYDRAPGTYLMFPSRFVPDRQPDNEIARQTALLPDWSGPSTTGLNDIVFMSSRDGINFDRSFMEAFVRPGPDVENWRERGIYVGGGIVQTSPEVISIYSRQHKYQPTVHIRRYALRTDGFVSVHAGYNDGELTTRPLIFSGRSLELNYSTSAVGSVKVEIQDAEGRPQPGFAMDDCPEMFADEIGGIVRWKGGADVSGLAGKPVKLRIALMDADLFAFKFND